MIIRLFLIAADLSNGCCNSDSLLLPSAVSFTFSPAFSSAADVASPIAPMVSLSVGRGKSLAVCNTAVGLINRAMS